MAEFMYPFIEIPEREGKPRSRGKTMVHDGGISLRHLELILETAAPYIDYYKFQSTHRLFPEAMTLNKLELCKQNDIQLYMGGNVAELCWVQGHWNELIAYAKKHGWNAFEISATYVPFTIDQRIELIKEVSGEGFEVFYEWGLKHPTKPLDPEEAADDIAQFLDAGASVIVIEEGEVDMLIGKDGTGEHADRLTQLIHTVGIERLMVEAGETKQLAWLLMHYGTDINIGNIHYDQAIDLEPLRRGIGRAVENFIYNRYLEKLGLE